MTKPLLLSLVQTGHILLMVVRTKLDKVIVSYMKSQRIRKLQI